MSKPVDSTRGAPPSTPLPEQKQKSKLDEIRQNVIVGSTSGMLTSIFVFPILKMKNFMQIKSDKTANVTSFSKNPYKGFGGFIGGFIPNTTMLVCTSGYLSNYISPMLASVIAGMSSAVFSVPLEGITIQQQLTGKNFRGACAHIYKNYGATGFYRGFSSLAMREGGFSLGCLGLAPKGKEKLQAAGLGEWLAQIFAGLGAGSIATVVTQAADTHKTRMQANYSYNIPFHKVVFDMSAYAGMLPRLFAIGIFTIAFPFFKEKSNKFYEQYK